MIVTCNLARDEIGDTLIDTVDMVSHGLRTGITSQALTRYLCAAEHWGGGRYETMVRSGSDHTVLYRSRTWQQALRVHDLHRRHAEERRINVIGPATYEVMYGPEMASRLLVY